MRILHESTSVMAGGTVYQSSRDVCRASSFPATEEYVSKQLIRSEITVNPKDEYGFRKPSPYQHTFFSGRMPLATICSDTYVRDLCGVVSASYSQFSNAATISPRYFSAALPQPSVFNLKPKQQLVNNAFADLKDQKLNVAMTLAFAGQTSRMIAQRAIDLRKLYLLAKNGQFKAAVKRLRKLGVRRHSKNAGDFYLEFLFGWAQLYRDLIGAYEELNAKSKPKASLVTGRASSKASRTVASTLGFRANSYVRNETVASHRCEAKVVVYGRIYSQGLHRLSSLGLLNPAELLWDVLKFSWIIDQFVHVAGYLSAYDATAGLEYLGGSYTEYSEVSGIIVPTVDPNGWDRTEMEGANPGFFRHTKSNRVNVDSSDIGIAIRNPFQANTAVAAAAVIALLNSMRSGGPVPRSYRT